MKLKLSNCVTKVEILLENLTDLEGSAYNYIFDVVLPASVDDGEYNYLLMDDSGNPLASGIAQIGEYVPQKQAYTGQTNKEYYQYNG